ncbi:MAG: prepilin-type N-terminal cleavage/methylation domain-containing protein [Thermodesulfobacteriota bacterium]
MKSLDPGLKESAFNRPGFTLIEIAIVLIIIGIIIGAVVKGKDIIRGAEQKKVYAKFLNEWQTCYLNFYDRTGKLLGDTFNGAGPGQDGKADTGAGASATPTDAGRDALITGQGGASPAYYGLSQLGLTAPSTNTDKSWKYRYSDSTGANHEVTISYAYDAAGKYNYMMIQDIPNELAMAMDKLVDGDVDGLKGEFIGDASGGLAWGTTPETGVTARWKMQF